VYTTSVLKSVSMFTGEMLKN